MSELSPESPAQTTAAPVAEAQRGHRRVEVSRLANRRVNQHRARRIDLGDLAAHQVAGHVEVVDRHVQKEAARDFNVFERRRGRVAAGDAQQVRRAHLARRHHRAHAAEVGVEAAVEPDLKLDPGLLHGGQGRVNPAQVEVNRLFAEDVLPGGGGLLGDLGVGVGGRGDDDGVNRRVVEQRAIVRDGDGRAELGGLSDSRSLLRGGEVDVGHGDQGRARDAGGDVPGM